MANKDALTEYLEKNPIPDAGIVDDAGEETPFLSDTPELSDEELRSRYQRLLNGEETEEAEEEKEEEEEDEEEEAAEGKKQPRRRRGKESEVDETIRQKAEEWDRFEERFARDPKGFIQALIEALPEEDRRSFSKSRASNEDADEEADDEEFEPLTAIERDYVKKFRPQVSKQIEEIRQTTSGHAAVLLDLLVEKEILKAAVETFLTINGYTIPETDREEFKRALLSGKDTGYRKKVERAFRRRMQASAARPETPSGSAAALNIRKGESMAEIMRKLEAAGI